MRNRTVHVKTLFVLVTIVAVASVVLSTASAKPRRPAGQPPDAVLVWNANAVKAVRASTPTKVQTDGMVYMSYVQAAVYDAVTKLDGRYQPYHDFAFAVVSGASVQAAVAAAARTTLNNYLPDQQPTVDAEYTTYLATLTGDVTDGVALGEGAAHDLIVGYAAMSAEVTILVVVAPGHEGRGIGSRLRVWAEQRDGARGSARHRQWIAASNLSARRLLIAADYQRERSYWRLTRRLDAVEAGPAPPVGVSLRPVDVDKDAAALHAPKR